LKDAEAKGRAEGKAEAITQMVKALHASGMPAEKIRQITQHSAAEVRAFLSP
jgi:hypothetical protein